MIKHLAWFTYDPEAHAYYFAPEVRTAYPYYKQIHVEAIIDVAKDGSLAGIEIIDSNMPLPNKASMSLENE